MMENKMLSNLKMPFCPGCGYNAAIAGISGALKNAGYTPHDVVLVSDIGCSGLIDPLFTTHTIHGLHGRSSALGLGVSLGLDNVDKKVVVIQGDGGATIGLQHLLEASRRNINMTLVVLNNMVYGMTGGQISGLSSTEFKELRNAPDRTPPFDICKLAHSAGAALAVRVSKPKAFEKVLGEAFSSKGFSLVELPSMCQPYGVKKLKELTNHIGEDVRLKNKRETFSASVRLVNSLFKRNEILKHKYRTDINGKLGVVIAGSAGGAVQLAAKLLASAAILSGYFTTFKGEYPITVGTGFSVAEIILSQREINYTGLESPDVMIILSEDGLAKVRRKMKRNTIVILDSSVNSSNLSSDKVMIQDLVKTANKRGAALMGIAYWLETFGTINVEALMDAASSHKYADDLQRIISLSRESQIAV